MMEEMVLSLFEKSLVGGAFVYLLYFFVSKFNASLERIAETLLSVSTTLISIDARMSKLESRVNTIEGR